MLNWKQSLYIGNFMVMITMFATCMLANWFGGPSITADSMLPFAGVFLVSAIIALKTGDYVFVEVES